MASATHPALATPNRWKDESDVNDQSAPVHPDDFARALQAAGLVENTDRITEIKIIARPQELVTIEVTYIADQRVLSVASPPDDPAPDDPDVCPDCGLRHKFTEPGQ